MLANPMNLPSASSSGQPLEPLATRQAIEAKGRSAPLKVTGKLRTAIEAMVWTGARRAQAAEQAGITDHGLRNALNKPHVKQFYLSQLEVLRTSERARNIHRLTEIRDKADNMPAVNAIKMLEQIDEASSSAGGTQMRSPGVVIIVQNGAAAHAPQAPNPVQVIDNAESEER
jgi:hypothetical protein